MKEYVITRVMEENGKEQAIGTWTEEQIGQITTRRRCKKWYQNRVANSEAIWEIKNLLDSKTGRLIPILVDARPTREGKGSLLQQEEEQRTVWNP